MNNITNWKSGFTFIKGGFARCLSILIILLATAGALKAHFASYAGIYLGQTGDGLGGFALFVDANQQAVLIGGYLYNDNDGDAYYAACTVDVSGNGSSDINGVTSSFTILPNGSVSFTATPDGTSDSTQMTGALVSSGPFLAVSGLYSGSVSGKTVPGIVAPDGWIYHSSPDFGGGGRVLVTAYGKRVTESSLGHTVLNFALNQNATVTVSGSQSLTLKRVDTVAPITNSAVVSTYPTGAGAISGVKNGQVLKIGGTYPVSATAARGFLFFDWTDDSGNILSTNTKFNYEDTDGQLRANFITDPFYKTPLAGTYMGLYTDETNGSFVVNSGYITITVNATGGFSGKLYNADYSKTVPSLSGQLVVSKDGSMATATLKPVQFGKHYAQVTLQVATDTNLNDAGAGTLTGFVKFYDTLALTNPFYTSTIDGKLAYNASNTPVGSYNFAISPVSQDPSQGPGGYSPGIATISKTGAVTLKLTLADGISAPISFAAALAKDGTCPVYAPLYGGEGLIMGWLQFDTQVSGSLDWFTASEFKSSTYTNGFSGTPSAKGDLYVAPKAGTNVMGWTVGGGFAIDFGYAGLSLPDQTVVFVTFNPVKNTFSDTGDVSITFKPATGALTGTIPGGSKKPAFSADVFNFQAYGFYKGAHNETGPIIILLP